MGGPHDDCFRKPTSHLPKRQEAGDPHIAVPSLKLAGNHHGLGGAGDVSALQL
jgi:hypothetical protein